MATPRIVLLCGLAALTLSACSRTDHQAPVPTGSLTPVPSPGETVAAASEATPDECGASKLGAYLNLLPTEETLAKIRATVGHDRIRQYGPNQAITMDYRPDRLNIETGVDGRIKRFHCV